MMVLPTKRELDLLEIIDDKNYSKEERKKAEEELMEIGKKEMENCPFSR